MNKWLLLLGCVLHFAFAQADFSDCFCADESSLDFGIGYRHDDLDWSIRADPNPSTGYPGADPLSTLQWKDLQILNLSLRAKIVFDGIYLRGEADWGKIFDGKSHDSDFEGISSPFEFSRSTSDANKGEVFDFSGGIGYQFQLFCDDFKIAPLVGYSLHEQHLRFFNTCQDHFFFRSPLGGFEEVTEYRGLDRPGVHSNYRACWYGPWLGLDAIYRMCQYTFLGSVEYHWARYHGTGHWNLRMDSSRAKPGDVIFTDDFRQKSNAQGVIGRLGVTYDPTNCWALGIRVSYLYFKGDEGTDRTSLYVVPGNEDKYDIEHLAFNRVITEVQVPFKGANWHSYSLEGTVDYKF